GRRARSGGAIRASRGGLAALHCRSLLHRPRLSRTRLRRGLIMVLPSLSAFHQVEFAGFYLPPLILWATAAIVPFIILRRLLERYRLYRLVLHRSLFNLSLYVLLVGGAVFLGDLAWP